MFTGTLACFHIFIVYNVKKIRETFWPATKERKRNCRAKVALVLLEHLKALRHCDKTNVFFNLEMHFSCWIREKYFWDCLHISLDVWASFKPMLVL